MDENKGQQRARRTNPALIVGIVVVLGIVFGVLAYNMVNNPRGGKVERIGDVLADLRTYDGLPVTFEGDVSGGFNVLGYKMYTLDDGTGSISVVTERGLPDDGTHLKVTGVIRQMFKIGTSNYTVLYESAGDS